MEKLIRLRPTLAQLFKSWLWGLHAWSLCILPTYVWFLTGYSGSLQYGLIGVTKLLLGVNSCMVVYPLLLCDRLPTCPGCTPFNAHLTPTQTTMTVDLDIFSHTTL